MYSHSDQNGDPLRDRWRKLEDQAIARGEFSQMSAAGRSLDDVLTPLIREHMHGAVLDAGAGRLALRPIAMACPGVERYVSIDYVASHPELCAVADLVAGLPFPDETFDCVLCSQVLEHVKEPWVAVPEMRRVLKVEGILILSVPHISFVHGAPEDYYRYTPYGVAHLLRRSGLEPLAVIPAGGILSLLTIPVSMGLLLASGLHWLPRPFRHLFQVVNRGVIAGSTVGTLIDRQRIFALNIVAIARKPRYRNHDLENEPSK